MRSGIATIVGRPNVGKSSLLNALVGKKLSIVSHKPQTTRHRIQGVVHRPEGQIVFVDTPGLHLRAKRALNRAMNDAATSTLEDVDVVLFVVESGCWTEEDDAVVEKLQNVKAPVGLLLNKVDRVKDKTELLPELEKLAKRREFAFVIPVSATKHDNVEALVREVMSRMPEGPPLYPPDMIAGHDEAFTAAELVREKLTRNLHQELPYALTVSIEKFEMEQRMRRISAVIWVEREGQKKIVIGEDGSALKRVGTSARRELEVLFGGKVFLQLWCRVKENWSDDPSALRQFGLDGN